MSIIILILVGALAGWVASIIMNTDRRMGPVANIVIGILGSMLGAFIYTLLTTGNGDVTTAFLRLDLVSVLVSIGGAVLLIAILKFFGKSRWL